MWTKSLTSYELEIHIVGHASLSKPARIYADYQSWKIKLQFCLYEISFKIFSQLSWISLNSVSQHWLSLPKKLSQRHDKFVAYKGIIIPLGLDSDPGPRVVHRWLGSLIPGFELVVGSFAWISSNIIVTRFIWNIFTFLFTDCFHTGFFKFTITVSQIALSFNTGQTNTFWKYIVKRQSG